MNKRHLLLALLLTLSYSLNAFAINAPIVEAIPSSVNADTYTITVFTEMGATVSVVGGPSQLAPVTDGAGNDAKDGEVEVEVVLAQNEVNSFSITAQMGADTSDAVLIEINEVSIGGGPSVPNTPLLDPVPESVETAKYTITGYGEYNAKINARNVDGDVVGTADADAEGYFEVEVSLELNKTNRINVSAENDEGEGKAAQAVIRQSSPEEEEEEEEEPELLTSSQIFFNDVEGHWAEDYINELYEEGVVSGKSEGIFDPNGLITRAELTKIAILAFGHSVNSNVDEHPFGDVPKNAWFAAYVEEAKALGFVSGYDGGGFGPNDFVTRAAALKILLGAAELDSGSSTPDFPDVPSDAWFASYVGYAQSNDVVGGYEDGSFGPGNNMTRAQVAKVVIKLLELKNKPTI